MTTTYDEAVDRLVDATTQLATFAEHQGTDRAQTAADLTAQITYAVTTNPEVERLREQVGAQYAAHQEVAAAYIAGAPQIKERLAGVIDRFAALADEVVELADEAAALDRTGIALAVQAQALGLPVPNAPQVCEGVIQGLRQTREQDGLLWMRLYLSGTRGRGAVAPTLSEAARLLRPA